MEMRYLDGQYGRGSHGDSQHLQERDMAAMGRVVSRGIMVIVLQCEEATGRATK